MKKRVVLNAILLSFSTLFTGSTWATLAQTQVSQFYVSIIGRASEGEGNHYWQTLGLDMSVTEEKLSKKIVTNDNFFLVKEKAEDLIGSGFTAGGGYGEIWIRDFNTFIELSCEVVDQNIIREKLLVFFKFQGFDGNIIDAYIPVDKITPGAYDYIYSELEPDLAAHKNTVETDQETSLIQAVFKYIKMTDEFDLLNLEIDGMKLSERMEFALEFLMDHRYNKEYGLLWGGTTADWGDVQPEDDWGVNLTDVTHVALDIYDNAMFVIAIKNLIEMVPEASSRWSPVLAEIETNIRMHLWDTDNMKFHPHKYIDGSPFSDDFNENDIFYHGGTAVAIEAGLLSKDEILISFEKMIENVEAIGAGSIGLTMYPAYPDGSFKNTIMSEPYTYQNGGDWTWFGGRMIQQLVNYGFVEEAYEQILPMTDRVIKNNGFYEWYSILNEPKGSASYRGSAGVLYKAIKLLDEWGRGTSVAAFVTRFYQQCLNREPDTGGLEHWADSLNNGDKTGAELANSFVFSEEFENQNTSDSEFVTILYKAFLNREPDTGGYNNWMNKIAGGASRASVLDGFTSAQEFKNLCQTYGITATSTSNNTFIQAFVIRFYQQCLSREPDTGGLNNWVNSLNNGDKTGGELAEAFIFSEEFQNNNTSDSEYVTILYRAFFNREPDTGGYNNWMNHMSNGTSRASILNGFTSAQEFEKLCEEYNILVN